MAGGSDNRIIIEMVDSTSSGGSDRGPSMDTSRGLGLEEFQQALKSFLSGIDKTTEALKTNTKQFERAADKQAKITKDPLKAEEDKLALRKKFSEEQRNANRQEFDRRRNLELDQARKVEQLRDEFHQKRAERNKRLGMVAGAGLSVAAVSSIVSALGSKLGSAQGTYATANSLVRPDIAYNALFASRLGAGTSALSTALPLATGALGMLAGPVGGILGYGAGSLLSTGLNYFAPQIAAGQQLEQSGNYFGQLATTGFGSRYAGYTAKQGLAAAVTPGGQLLTPQQMQAFSGAGVGAGALQAFQSGNLGLSELTGNPDQMQQITTNMAGIIKQLGIGTNQKALSQAYSKITENQIKYGGDINKNLQDILTTLQKGTQGASLDKAISNVYKSGLLSPALQQANVAFLQSGAFNQWQQETIARAVVGHGFDLAKFNAGDSRQIALARRYGVGKYGGPGSMPSNMAFAALFPDTFSLAMNTNTKNTDLAVQDVARAQHQQYFTNTVGGGRLPTDVDLSQAGVPTQVTQQMQSAEAAPGTYDISAKSMQVAGDLIVAGIKGIPMVGQAVSMGQTMMKMMHKDMS